MTPRQMRDLKRQVCELVDRRSGELWDLALRIHARPELRFQEKFASGALVDFLRAAGFAAQRGVCQLETAFRCELQGRPGGPTVALLAEYDALEGLGHACGHNLIAAMAAGAGAALAALGAFPGRLVVLGTPGEEGGGGKVIMLERGGFAGVDAALMVHPGRENRVLSHFLCREALEFTFYGRAAHAASAPHEGINALDAAVLTYNGLSALRQHLKPDVRLHGVFTHGGAAPNIVPDYAAMRWFVRAADRDYLQGTVLPKVRACAEGAAQAAGARVEVRSYAPPYLGMRNNHALADAFRANLEFLGRAVVEPRPGGGGSSDIGNVSHRLPAIHPTIQIGAGLIGHTAEFAAAAASAGGRDGMLDGAKAMALTALDLFHDPDLMERVRAEFASGFAVA